MATLVLSTIGNAIAPGIGSILGGIAGSLIDSKLLAGHAQNGRIDDLQLGSATEGAPKNYCHGPENRVPGQLIWCPLAIEVPPGGKGAPSTSGSTYVQDLALSFAGHEIESIEKIWANGKVIWNNAPNIAYSSTLISSVAYQVWTYDFQTETYVVQTTYLDLNSTSSGPDLGALQSGVDVTIGGFTTTAVANNGTWRVLSSGPKSGGGTTCRLETAPTVPITKSAGDTVTVAQTLPQFSTKIAAGFSFFNGTSTQTASALIQSYEGAGEVSAYRRDAGVIINQLALESFGNRVPEFQALVNEATSRTVGEAIGQIFERSGRDSTYYDVSAVTTPLRGYWYSGPTAGVDAIDPLMVAFDLLVHERDGKLYFFSREDAETTVIDANDLAAHDFGSDVPRVAEITDGDSSNLPSQVSVAYANPDADYQAGSQTERRINYANNSAKTLNLRNIVLTDSQARIAAKRTLWTTIANRQSVKVSLPPSKMASIESDRITVPLPNEDLPVLIRRRTRGSNWMLEIDGIVERGATLTWTDPGSDGTSVDGGDIYIPPQMMTEILDLPPLQDAHVTLAGFYDAVCLWDVNLSYGGGALLESINGGSTYVAIESLPAETAMGFTTTVLGNAVPYYWDRKATVRVVLNHGSASSVSEDDCLNGENRWLIGQEIVGAAVATLVSENTYDLSTLLRGLQNTERFMSSHLVGERAVHLNSVGLGFHDAGYGCINSTRMYKAVPVGGLPGLFSAVTAALKGATLKPFGPCNVTGSRLLGPLTNDLTINWYRRTRSPMFRMFSGVVPPLNEENEAYEIDILNDAETAVLRTIAVTTQTTVVYTAAQQVTDFGSAHASVHMKLYQISAVVGRGNYTRITL